MPVGTTAYALLCPGGEQPDANLMCGCGAPMSEHLVAPVTAIVEPKALNALVLRADMVKWCTVCRKVLFIHNKNGTTNFHKNRGYYHSYCKQCTIKNANDYYYRPDGGGPRHRGTKEQRRKWTDDWARRLKAEMKATGLTRAQVLEMRRNKRDGRNKKIKTTELQHLNRFRQQMNMPPLEAMPKW